MKRKSTRQLRGTDETFFQLMQLSGAGLLKLAGFPPEIAEAYEFRAVEFKEKQLQRPDVEGMPILETVTTRVTLEFQGYADKYIRYRCLNNMLQICLKSRDEKPVVGIIVYTQAEYEIAALSLDKLICSEYPLNFIKELILTDYTEEQLLAADPRLIILAPFTIPLNTKKILLMRKVKSWRAQIYQNYPDDAKLTEALNVIGLFLLSRFRHLTHEEIINMLNMDLMETRAGQDIFRMGIAKGEVEGIEKGKVEGRAEGIEQTKKETCEQLIMLLKQRFSFEAAPEPLITGLQAIEKLTDLIQLVSAVYQYETLADFLAHPVFKQVALEKSKPRKTRKKNPKL